MGTEVKQPGDEADHSPPSNAEVMNDGVTSISPLPISFHEMALN
jgi:hypothetical protein